MELKHQLAFCRKCEKRAFSNEGIICAITNQKPTFIDNCKTFSIDPKEAKRIALKTYESKAENSKSNSSWIYIGIGLIVIRIIIRIMRN